ncbi:MAG: arginine--tRNA ligase [Phycisphaeraceae bacterium]|nr:arginine--tRNA ligase [Phycisphaeraceae bacterium]
MSSPTFDPIQVLADRFRSAIARAYPEAGDSDPLITASRQTNLGDFQSNAAMPLAKKLGVKPRDAAAAILKHLDLADLAEPLSEASIAGPGFINIRLRADTLAELVAAFDTPDLGIDKPARPQTIVVDLMGVNLAKQMHVGHIRSPFIGDAIARTLERLGHTVIRQNHVGDWGLNIAMTVMRIMDEVAAGTRSLDSLTLDDLDTAYRLAQASCQRDLAGLQACRTYGLGPKAEAECQAQVDGATEAFTRARQVLVQLQGHEPRALAVWQRIADVTMAECLAVCKRLHINVTAEHSAGESTYAAELAPMVEDLLKRGIAEESDGALVVRLDDPRYGAIKEPCLIRKSDGGFLYATTDVCAVRRRVQKIGAERIIYAIDARQNLHLRQVWGAARRAGYARHPVTGEDAMLEHAAFGAILGDDGRPFKTRTGDPVKLSDLIEQAVTAAAAIVREKSPDLSPAEHATIAETVAVAALKHADLCQERVKDYVFSFGRMISFEGNTGPYMLMAVARIKNIFRKAANEIDPDLPWPSSPLDLREPQEKQLALALLRYPGAVRAVGQSLEPHRLSQYLFELAGAFSSFYDACPVLKSEGGTRLSRLRLCSLTERVLTDGLSVLGIPTLERM